MARSDGSVARVLPFVFAHLADGLDPDALRRATRGSDLKHTVGFMLELAGTMGGRQDLVQWAAAYRDERVRRLRPFFPGESKYARAFAEARTPELARRWGWRMNMGLETFASVFDKFADAPAHA